MSIAQDYATVHSYYGGCIHLVPAPSPPGGPPRWRGDRLHDGELLRLAIGRRWFAEPEFDEVLGRVVELGLGLRWLERDEVRFGPNCPDCL